MVNFTPRSPYQRERTTVPIELKVVWALETVWIFWEREKFLVPARIRAPNCPARSLVANRLRLPCSLLLLVPYIVEYDDIMFTLNLMKNASILDIKLGKTHTRNIKTMQSAYLVLQKKVTCSYT
jgi:hypothetical protein